MKVLLDECLPLDFRHSFPNHDVHTAQWAGLKGSTTASCCWLPKPRGTMSY
jgi:predicted nuclease of predicted toxin-antitoxin system